MKVLNKNWFKAAAVRSIKTFAQTFAAGITMGAAFSELDWAYMASVAGVAAVYSIVTSVAGLPEVDPETGDAEVEIPKGEHVA